MSYTVFVHAYEHVNPGLEAGNGGFDWFWFEDSARRAYTQGNYPSALIHANYTADFLFSFETEHDPQGDDSSREKITEEIDENLNALCAEAKERRVGANVVAYWRKERMKMGNSRMTASELAKPSTWDASRQNPRYADW